MIYWDIILCLNSNQFQTINNVSITLDDAVAPIVQAKQAAENACRKAEGKRIADELCKLKLERQKLNGEISRLKR